jgi:hypothetical protein
MTIKDGRNQCIYIVVPATIDEVSHPATTSHMQMVTPSTRPAVEFMQAQADSPASGCMPSPDAFFKAEWGVEPVDGDVKQVIVMPRRRHTVPRADRDQFQVRNGLVRHGKSSGIEACWDFAGQGCSGSMLADLARALPRYRQT